MPRKSFATLEENILSRFFRKEQQQAANLDSISNGAREIDMDQRIEAQIAHALECLAAGTITNEQRKFLRKYGHIKRQ